MSTPDSEPVVPGRSRSRDPYGDIVDFVERTTYAIWNDRRIDLISAHYRPDSVIWEESASSAGHQVTVDSERKQACYPDLRGVIPTPSGLVMTAVGTRPRCGGSREAPTPVPVLPARLRAESFQTPASPTVWC